MVLIKERAVTMKEKKISINFIFNLFKTLMSLIFPLITFPYASRVLGVDNLGKVQYCNSIVSYFLLIASLGISIYAVREGSKYKDDKYMLSKFSKEILIINTLSTTIAYIAFIIFVVFFFRNDYYILIIICSLSIFFTTYSIEWLYQIKEEYKYISIRAFIMQLLSLILLFVFVKSSQDYIYYALISIIGASGNFIFNMVHAKDFINIFGKYNLEIKKHIKPIFTIFGISIASSIYMNLDTVMLGAMKSTVAVGLYTAAVKIVQVVKTLVGSFSNVLFPRLSNYLGNNKFEEYEKLLFQGLRIILMITIPAAVGMCMLSKEIIIIFSGNEYIEASLASKILSINVIFSIIDGALYYQILLPFGKEKFATLSTMIGACINFILNFIMIPYFSYVGAALTTLIAEFCVFLGLFYFSNKLMNIKSIVSYFIRYILYTIPFIIFCMLVKIVLDSVFLTVIVSIIGSVFLYFLILFIFKDRIFVQSIDIFRKKFFISNS